MHGGWMGKPKLTPQVWVPTRKETQNIYSFTKHSPSDSYVVGTGRGAEVRMVCKTKLSAFAEIPPSKRKGRDHGQIRKQYV